MYATSGENSKFGYFTPANRRCFPIYRHVTISKLVYFEVDTRVSFNNKCYILQRWTAAAAV